MPESPGTPPTDPPRPRTPPFAPHPWVRGGHLQTILARYLPGPRTRLPSQYHELRLADGDRLALLESTPAGWRPGSPTALFVHGLGGCARSPYVTRVARSLWVRGVRVVRVNLRGAGAGRGLARGVYHAGRSEDVRAVAAWAAGRAPGSPIGLVGFSLGAALVLKLAAEAADGPVAGLDCVLAANPPIDLAACSDRIGSAGNRVYDRNFVRQLRAEVARVHEEFPDLGAAPLPRRLTLRGFDDAYTAPRNGFDGLDDYYGRSSVAPLIPKIAVPGLVVHALDDPFIPAGPFLAVHFPDCLALELTPGGGHLGYLSHDRWGDNRRWLDTRLLAWLADRWSLADRPASF